MPPESGGNPQTSLAALAELASFHRCIGSGDGPVGEVGGHVLRVTSGCSLRALTKKGKREAKLSYY